MFYMTTVAPDLSLVLRLIRADCSLTSYGMATKSVCWEVRPLRKFTQDSHFGSVHIRKWYQNLCIEAPVPLASWCRCCRPARKDRTCQALRPFSSRCLVGTRILAATLVSQCSSKRTSSSFPVIVRSSSRYRRICHPIARP
jgi:hypothetical protein